jgi:hypothetical protein
MCGEMKQYDLTCKICVKHLCGPAVVTNDVKFTRSSFSKTHNSRLQTEPPVVLLFLDFFHQQQE